jgi:hypothetical protein
MTVYLKQQTLKLSGIEQSKGKYPYLPTSLQKRKQEKAL